MLHSTDIVMTNMILIKPLTICPITHTVCDQTVLIYELPADAMSPP